MPALPGIYQFKDKTDKIIYIGKAKDLTKKVGDGVKSTTKGATKGIKNLNPFKK